MLIESQSSDLLEQVLLFTLRSLSGSDPLPKFAAADFWVSEMIFHSAGA